MVVTGSNALASDIGENRRATTLNLLNLFFRSGRICDAFYRRLPVPYQHRSP